MIVDASGTKTLHEFGEAEIWSLVIGAEMVSILQSG